MHVESASNGRPLQRHAEVEGGELALITRDLGTRTGAETALVARWDESGQRIEILSSWGARAGHEHLAIAESEGFVARVLKYGSARSEPLNWQADFSAGIPASGARLTHAVGAPVQPPGGPPGAICAGFAAMPPGDGAASVWVVESYARLASLCLHDPGMLDGLLESAGRDHLTGCLNYASARAQFTREIKRSARHALCLSCAFIDLDGFKGVNEHYGHLVGNRVLAEAAAALRATVRSDDTLGRFGGDEFIAILPETDAAEARALANRLRATLTGRTLDAANRTLDASIGIAEWRAGDSAEGVLEQADRALRVAKANGGGTVVSAGDLTPRGAHARAATGDLSLARPGGRRTSLATRARFPPTALESARALNRNRIDATG